MSPVAEDAALIVIDVQAGFDDPYWGASNNPGCEANVEKLIAAWRPTGRPIVVVRHDSRSPASPLHPSNPGNRLKSFVAEHADVLITKNVNSAFIGEPDLHAWLQARKIQQLVICGIQTNMCVETTARMGGNLGYQVLVPLDATRTFDLTGPARSDGTTLQATANDLMNATAINLHGGGFAEVTSTVELLERMSQDTIAGATV